MIESMEKINMGAQDFLLSQSDFYSENRLNEIRCEIKKIYESLGGEEKPRFEPFFYAMVAYGRLKEHNMLGNSPYICVTDFSKPNTDSRFFIINLNTLQVENTLCVGHGKKSGAGEYATQFSNKKGSLQSSLGAFRTLGKLQYNKKGTWQGLELEGADNLNYNAKSRRLFIHPGGLDKSEGCFTLPYPENVVYDILQKLEGGCLVYSYFDEKSTKRSRLMNPTYHNIPGLLKISVSNIKKDIKDSISNAKKRIVDVLSLHGQKGKKTGENKDLKNAA